MILQNMIFILAMFFCSPSDKQNYNEVYNQPNNVYTIASNTTDTIRLKIIKVSGEILHAGTNKPLLPGQDIDQTSNLIYSSPTDFCIAINQQMELMIARPDSTLSEYLFSPIKSKQKARAGKMLTYMAFEQYLRGRDLLILGGQMGIEVGAEEFPLDTARFFYIQYFYGSDSIEINKKLTFESQHILIIRDSLFEVDNKPLAKDSTYRFSLYYYNMTGDTSLFINTFNPIFPDEELLKNEVAVLLEFLGKFTPREIKLDLIEGFLFESYGVPDQDNLSAWMQKEFEL